MQTQMMAQHEANQMKTFHVFSFIDSSKTYLSLREVIWVEGGRHLSPI